jgi:hypothetical protein
METGAMPDLDFLPSLAGIQAKFKQPAIARLVDTSNEPLGK